MTAMSFRDANRLRPRQCLFRDDPLTAPNDLLRLALEQNGNIVLYRSHFGRALWSSGTAGTPVDRGKMQPDGKFAALSPQGVSYWSIGSGQDPGAGLTLQDDGNMVLADKAGRPLWMSNTTQDFSSPTFMYTDEHGFTFVETSERWKDMCVNFPCFDLLQWPDYSSTHIDAEIDGEPVVIQVWKGWCQKFLGLQSFPGGVGAEVGVYRRVQGHQRNIALSSLPPALATIVSAALVTLGDDALWWPAPDLNTRLEYWLRTQSRI